MEYIQESLFGRTYPEPLAVTEDKILGQSLKKSQRPKFQCLQVVNGQLQEWLEGTDVVLRGECLTRNIGEYPNAERESSLSQILQDNVPEKYYLSSRATIGILRRAAKRGKELPPVLRMALEEQSGLRRDTIGQKEIADTGALLRKLWETVDKTTFEQWLRGSLVLVQQKKILRFDLLCGVEKETAEKAEVCEVGQGCSEVTDTEGELRELWETGCNGHPPQGWEPVKQFARELNKALQEVSYQRTPAEVFLLCMWQASESEKSLRQSLQGVYAEVGEGAASSDNVITSWSPKMWKEGSGATNPLLATDYKDPQVVIRRSVSGDFAESRKAREEVAGSAGDGVDVAKSYGLVSKGNGEAWITPERHMTLNVGGGQAGQGYPAVVVAPSNTGQITSPQNGNKVEFGLPCHTLSANEHPPSVIIATKELGKTSGAIAFNGDQSAKTRSMGESFEQSPTLRSGGPVHVAYQRETLHLQAFGPGGQHDIAHALRAQPSKADKPSSTTYVLQNNMIGRQDKNGPQGNGVNEGISFTLNTTDRHAVAQLYENHSQDTRYKGPLEVAQPVTATYGMGGNNQPFVVKPSTYTVRRLTPTECERLQGFPDNWTDIPNASDSARYKTLGNSVAVPCVSWIIGRIAESERMP